MKKKLKIQNLKVNSFITGDKTRGGACTVMLSGCGDVGNNTVGMCSIGCEHTFYCNPFTLNCPNQ